MRSAAGLALGADRALNVRKTVTPSEELSTLAAEARRELASAEARLSALLDRTAVIAAAATKDQSELQRFQEMIGPEASFMANRTSASNGGTGPLLDVDAIRVMARELSNDVARSQALTANLDIAITMLQSACEQLSPDQAFRLIQNSTDVRLQQAMNSAREDERRRLAREIHDGPAQVLSNAIFGIHTVEQIVKRAYGPGQVADELVQLRDLLKDGVAEIRRFMFDLRPTMLQDFGLGPTLARYIDDYSRFFAKKVTLTGIDTLPPLNGDQELTIFRIVQEGLQNIHKHAGPDAEAWVGLQVAHGALVLTIRDDGKGFDLNGLMPRPGHGAGLPGIKDRAMSVRSELNVTSQSGVGTTIELKMPLGGQTGTLRAAAG